MRANQVMKSIPASASLIFEFNNDKSFYDVYDGNKLFAAVAGTHELDELGSLRHQLLLNPMIERYFAGQNIFISVHPLNKNDIGLLFTLPSTNGFDAQVLEDIMKQTDNGLVITPFRAGLKQGFTVYIKALKKRFYISIDDNNILSGSFSKQLVNEVLGDGGQKGRPNFNPLSEKQNANSLANLYVNFSQLTPLFNQLFKNKNTPVFEGFRDLPVLGTLSINYRSDVLMFNGLAYLDPNKPTGYVSLFSGQQPVINHLKDILPSTTAYSINFAVSAPAKFGAALSRLQVTEGQDNEKEKLFNTVKAETGLNLPKEFYKLLGKEFAVVTTRYLEEFVIISVNNGSKLKLLLSTISKMTNENKGVFNYDKLPFFLLGDALKNFRRPYFMVLDNYLILSNNAGELTSYYDSYVNRKFLSKNEKYNQFDYLLAERSNVAFLFNFKNSMEIIKRDMYPDVYEVLEKKRPGWGNFYGASCQFSSSNKSFYINLCLQLNSDTTETTR